MIPHVAIGTPRSSGASALIECAGPLSPVQAAAWKNRTLDRRDGVDVVQVLGRLHEEIQPSRLENAWKAAVARHSGLRTALRWEGVPEPLQEVHRQATVCVEYEDWSAWPDTEDRAARIEDWLSADRAKGFDLQQPPLLRLKLFGFSTRDFLLVWTYHRILLDTRSVAAVIREVLGEQAGPGQAVEQPPSPAALFSRTEAEAYWRETLRGFPTPTPLMIDRAGGAAAGAASNAGIHELTLSPSASRAVEDLAAREGASAGTVLRAAWALLLHRYSGEPDVLFGVQSERAKAILEGTAAVGNHTNTVPARVRIPNTASTSDFLRSVRDGENAARPFEDTPLTAIRRWSEVPSGVPLFDSQLLLEGPRLNAQLRAAGPEWLARDFRVQERHECSLTMSCHLEREIALRVLHDRGRIDDAAARRVLGHFERLVRGMVEAPDGPVAELALLTDAEMEQLRSWNETGAALPQRRVTDLFEAQAARTPDRVAVAFELNSWSYRELNERANQIARHLARQGVQPGDRVGILIEPEPLMVASLLGILKAGAAYVPLDPAFPAERLRFMMEDANLSALVTRKRFRARLPAGHAKAIDLDSDWTAIQTEDAANPAFPAPGDADAYLIYTSGSTGRPKGVPVAHSALANLLCAMRDEPGLAESDVLLAVTTISFDIAGLELFLPLIVGARLTLIGRGVASDPSALAHAIVEIRPTVMQATPSLWQMLLEAGWPGNSDMKILCGGEALSRKLANRLEEMSASLWNLYGPTETTIWSTAHRISPAQGPVPIGRPIANTSVHVLDSLARSLPLGIAGELYIGGAGVARGYWNRPDLSAERFVPSPLPDRPGELLYRTGDVARYLDDGSLEYVGRADHQVKIRGFRIELGEIEGALAQHPSVHQCIVLARDDEDDTRRLVAYLVVDRTREVRTDELRTFLAKTLPDYMIPSAFVFVDAYPMTPNGKVDRKALPRPGEDRRGLASAVGPVHESEQILVKIWESVLRTRPIGIHDNFFDLGGDSHLALRLFIRIEKLTGRRLPLATLLGAPTIATLAPHLSGDDPVSWRSLVMIQSGADRRPIFLVPGIGGNAVGYHALARHIGADQPVFGLQALGLDGKTEPLFRIEDMAAHYVREIKASGFRPPFHLAGASFGGLVAYEMARQLQAAGEGVGIVALFDSYAPLSTPSILGTRLAAPALSQQWSRLRFHARKLLMEPDWVGHLRGSTKTLARRVRSRVWQMAYQTYARRLSRLPPYFRRVEEAGQLASRSYMPAPAPVRVELFRASIRAVDDKGDPDMGWARIATGGVKITNVPGDHLTMLGTPHVEVVGRALRKSLDEEDAARPSRPTAP